MEKHQPDIEERKRDHIDLALEARVLSDQVDTRFHYEPLLSGHPSSHSMESTFLDRTLLAPIWISSMTGGTQRAGHINHNLARACKEFKLGMGLGSCRSLLHDSTHIADFDVRDSIGDQPLYGNLGIAQVEHLMATGKSDAISTLVDRLRLDGMIVHVNPLQEWCQPEGDRLNTPPIETIKRLLDVARYPIIIKEVGQGMGLASLRALLELPIAAVDFAANGGTNFAMLELMRAQNSAKQSWMPLAHVGHTAEQMLLMVNDLVSEMGTSRRCDQLIISGGIQNFLDGYYLLQKSSLPAIYGQASAFLQYAMGDYEGLQAYVKAQVEGLAIAHSYLRVR